MPDRVAFTAKLRMLALSAYVAVHSQGVAAQQMAPELIRSVPTSATPGIALELDGYRLRPHDPSQVRVLFVQGGVTRRGQVTGAGQDNVDDPQGGLQHLSVVVPNGLVPGPCQLTVVVDGTRSATISIDIMSEIVPAVVESVEPAVAQPGETVTIEGVGFARSDVIELTDAGGETHPIRITGTTVPATRLGVVLPLNVADGDATLRVVEKRSGLDQTSNALSLRIKNGPLPLAICASCLMPVAPGQWLDLRVSNQTAQTAFERADRTDVAFIQQSSVIVPIVGRHPRVLVPRTLAPGPVTITTRTWRDGSVSAWSEPVSLVLRDRLAPPFVKNLQVMKHDRPNHLGEPINPEPTLSDVLTVRPGDTLVLNGTFPVVAANRLQVILEGNGQRFHLTPSAFAGPDALKFRIGGELRSGDWQLLVRNIEDGASARLPITLRVE